MMEEQANLAANFSAVLSAAQQSPVDYRIAVTTTGIEASPSGWSTCPGGVEGGEAGRLFPADNSSPRVLTRQTLDAASVFARNVQVGMCHWNEQGLEAAYRALSSPLVDSADDLRTLLSSDGNEGFYRPTADLAIVWLSDEEDASPRSLEFYEDYFRRLKNNDVSKLRFSAIVGPEDLTTCTTASSSGTRYSTLAQRLGGVTQNICTNNWALALQNVSQNAFGPRSQFALSQLPQDAGMIQVFVDGTLISQGIRYDAVSRSVIFDWDTVPQVGSIVEVTYPVGCP
jgi:hypothetical protein